jgi:hypothetical protein
MSISGPSSNNPWKKRKSDGSESPLDEISDTSAILEINHKKVKLKKEKVKEIVKELVDDAYSMGETNDKKLYSEDMSNDIIQGLNKK